MFEVKEYFPNIKIDLCCGAYVFDIYSATGKTYLYKIAEKYRHFGVPIAGYTYNDHLDCVPIKSRLDSNKFKIAILDRYDLYYGSYTNEIKEFIDGGGIILVDTKRGVIPSIKSRICFVHLDKRSISVSGRFV